MSNGKAMIILLTDEVKKISVYKMSYLQNHIPAVKTK